MLDVSVIIVNWNTRALLAKAITSARLWAGRQTVETIVVDNASSDGSAAMVRSLYSNAQLIANTENVGFARAANQGLAQARGRYVLFLDADAELTRGCLDELVRVMDAHPDIGACSPALSENRRSVPAGVFPRLWLHLLSERAAWRRESRMIRRCYRDAECFDVEWIFGAALMVRREVIEQVGGLDERLFLFYEDTDWCRRMARRRWRRVIVPGAYAKHAQGASVGQVPALQSEFRMTMAEYTYWRLHQGRFLTAILYSVRSARLGSRWAFMVVWNLFCRNRDPKVKQALRQAAARFGWHLRHAVDVLIKRPRPYKGD
jgi:N-acetylglucosaminyl-diphospho-decaprenol L-rhamnosyltransferase